MINVILSELKKNRQVIYQGQQSEDIEEFSCSFHFHVGQDM